MALMPSIRTERSERNCHYEPAGRSNLIHEKAIRHEGTKAISNKSGKCKVESGKLNNFQLSIFNFPLIPKAPTLVLPHKGGKRAAFTKPSRADNLRSCKTMYGNRSYGNIGYVECSTVIIKDGWKIKDDYPW